MGLLASYLVVGAVGVPTADAAPGVTSVGSACPTAATSTAASCTFAYTGDLQTFTVPAGVTHLDVIAIGAAGGSAPVGGSGGQGASVEDLAVPVRPGDRLTVVVGGVGTSVGDNAAAGGAGGTPGGGGDGGDVTGGGGSNNGDSAGGGGFSGVLAGDGSALVIGGGGGGGAFAFAPGGAGDTGSGGGTGGSFNSQDTEPDSGYGGGGAVGSTGGDGGAGGAGFGGGDPQAGLAGTSLQGGTGGSANGTQNCSGGGGGGGYAGGGGGGAGGFAGGAGGGGSSYGVTGLTHQANTSDPASVTISFVVSERPEVTALSPSTGPAAGGQTVVVTGAHFTGATRVLFGTVRITDFVVDSDTQITLVSPPRGQGKARVQVRVHVNGGGTSARGGPARYTYNRS